MSIRATREGLYWLLCDINAYVSTALDAYRAGDMEALGTELKGCAEYVRNEIDDMGAETPDIENSEDPLDVIQPAGASGEYPRAPHTPPRQIRDR
jgi:hypothetical protein